MNYLVPAALVIGTVVFMEWFAAWSHKHIMHGWGWRWHKSHHEPHDHALEKNDLYAVIFAVISVAMFYIGNWYWPLWWIAVGVSVYGALYFFMHDGLVHQRWPFRYIPRKGYLKRVYQAHRLHHAVEGRDGCVSFGFVYAKPADTLVKELQENKLKLSPQPPMEEKKRDVRA
ncbi:sterol desaturase family protein [Sinorhizobium medicae]|uniref:Beta-carotene hydroxylase n=1 Tax=Sinorhizobium medicae TaxID=110321 RepID=A0A508XC88_9HYPH|nr:sterol desaturase family protein [Sinorhizobium medicae]MDX0769979.1 beta-carotene hydroxylase [Sinorhizobium medicae]VTZ65979.1 Beta-carotene hydroxylase [Sinorhizobium medicae]